MPLFIGLMSGTSLDGIDAALVRCGEGPVTLIEATGMAMPETLRQRLLMLCHSRSLSFDELAHAEADFCRLQADAVARLLAKSGVNPEDIQAIGSHGQTIEHAPCGYDDNADAAFTWQMDNPSLLAELTGCRVVADFRRRDLAAGGQAAPLAPAFHAALFSDANEGRILLNLGGFANLTLLPPTSLDMPVLGFDTGPANALLDAWYTRHNAGRYDADGAWAEEGHVDESLLARLLDEPFFRRPPPKSTGRELFHLDWLSQRLTGNEAPQDVQATLAELTAVSVAKGIEQALHRRAISDLRLIPCGGGAHNQDLLRRITRHASRVTLARCEDFGWSPDWLEAGAFAWLAWRRLEELPGNLPSVTGAAGPRILGGVYSA